MTRNKGVIGPPPVCLTGKNITSIIAKDGPKWELKTQRFKNEG
jgi:hypothetical protein